MSRAKRFEDRIAKLKTSRSLFIATYGEPETLDGPLAAELAELTQDIKMLSRALLTGQMILKNELDMFAIMESNRLDAEILDHFLKAVGLLEAEILQFSKSLGRPKVIVWSGRHGPELEDASN